MTQTSLTVIHIKQGFRRLTFYSLNQLLTCNVQKMVRNNEDTTAQFVIQVASEDAGGSAPVWQQPGTQLLKCQQFHLGAAYILSSSQDKLWGINECTGLIHLEKSFHPLNQRKLPFSYKNKIISFESRPTTITLYIYKAVCASRRTNAPPDDIMNLKRLGRVLWRLWFFHFHINLK